MLDKKRMFSRLCTLDTFVRRQKNGFMKFFMLILQANYPSAKFVVKAALALLTVRTVNREEQAANRTMLIVTFHYLYPF